MNPNKDPIDHIFRQGLGRYEPEPSDQLYRKVQSRAGKSGGKHRKRWIPYTTAIILPLLATAVFLIAGRKPDHALGAWSGNGYQAGRNSMTQSLPGTQTHEGVSGNKNVWFADKRQVSHPATGDVLVEAGDGMVSESNLPSGHLNALPENTHNQELTSFSANQEVKVSENERVGQITAVPVLRQTKIILSGNIDPLKHFDNGLKKTNRRWQISLDPVIGFGIMNSMYSGAMAADEQGHLSINRAAVYTPGSWNAGLLFGLSYRGFSIQTGPGLQTGEQKLWFDQMLVNEHDETQRVWNNTPFDFENNGNYFRSDTHSYWHYYYIQDSVIHKGDSVWRTEYDTLQVNPYDFVNQRVYDTLRDQMLRTKYRSLEWPVWIGGSHQWGRWSLSVAAGIIPGWLFRVSGDYYNGQNVSDIHSAQMKFSIFTLSAGIKIGLGYQIGERLGIYAEPFYRRDLIGIREKSSGITVIRQWYGLQAGLRIRLN